VAATIGDIASRVDAHALAGPAVMMIGWVLGLQAAAASEDRPSDTMSPRDRAASGQH